MVSLKQVAQLRVRLATLSLEKVSQCNSLMRTGGLNILILFSICQVPPSQRLQNAENPTGTRYGMARCSVYSRRNPIRCVHERRESARHRSYASRYDEASLETDRHEPNSNMTGRLRNTSWNKHDTKCIVYVPLYQAVALFTRLYVMLSHCSSC